MIKKTDLLAAAARVVQKKGLNSLTLEAVAAEAGVSKGGLLYHFSTKENLIKGLNEQNVSDFQSLVDEELEKNGSYVQSYVRASFNPVNYADDLSADLSLLAAVANNKELLHMWEPEYERFRQKASEEAIPFEKGMILRLVCDGLLFSKMFNLDPLSNEEQARVLKALLEMIEGEKGC